MPPVERTPSAEEITPSESNEHGLLMSGFGTNVVATGAEADDDESDAEDPAADEGAGDDAEEGTVDGADTDPDAEVADDAPADELAGVSAAEEEDGFLSD